MFPKEDKRCCIECKFAKVVYPRKSCVAASGFICTKNPFKPVFMGIRGRCSDRKQLMMKQYPRNN